MLKLVLTIILFQTIITSCSYKSEELVVRTGDILFRGNHKKGLSEAINKVTQTSSKTSYTHMGICKMQNDSIYVIHAHPQRGVCQESIDDFCYPNNDTSFFTDVFRIKKSLNINTEHALTQAESLLGQPYDHTYIMSEPGYYCSEFVYELFKSDSLFSLNPMTFIDPSTGNFHSSWKEHYHQLGLSIPEGLPGCNPNQMAAEGKLDFIFRLKK